MVGGDHKWIASIAISVLSVSLLAGCAAETSPNVLTLAQTKSPVQLLRNETASRVPTTMIEDVVESEDVSVACKTIEADPLGLMRKWKSSVLMTIKTGSAWRTLDAADEVVQTYVDEGWTSSRGFDSAVTVTVLASERQATAIEVQAREPDKGGDDGATIRVTTTGPCVATEGADSAEIRKLEKRDE